MNEENWRTKNGFDGETGFETISRGHLYVFNGRDSTHESCIYEALRVMSPSVQEMYGVVEQLAEEMVEDGMFLNSDSKGEQLVIRETLKDTINRMPRDALVNLYQPWNYISMRVRQDFGQFSDEHLQIRRSVLDPEYLSKLQDTLEEGHNNEAALMCREYQEQSSKYGLEETVGCALQGNFPVMLRHIRGSSEGKYSVYPQDLVRWGQPGGFHEFMYRYSTGTSHYFEAPVVEDGYQVARKMESVLRSHCNQTLPQFAEKHPELWEDSLPEYLRPFKMGDSEAQENR